MSDRDAIVVGAGPVGLAAALALRAYGVEVTVLEAGAADRERPGSRAIFTHSATVEILDRLSPGLGDELDEAGYWWATQRTFFEGAEVYAKTYPEPEPGVRPHFTSLPQVQIEAMLRRHAVAAGVEFAFGQDVTALGTEPDGVTASTAEGASWRARYAVGADGARSAVRKQIGAVMQGGRDDGWYIVVDVAELDEPALPIERVFHYSHPAVEGRNVLVVPYAGGWRVDLQLRPEDDAEAFGSSAGVREWLGAVLPPGYADRVTWVSTYQFMQLVASTFTDQHRRVLLAGEAAHLFAPFGARGLNSGRPGRRGRSPGDRARAGGAHAPLAAAGIEAAARARRSAALFNRDAAGEALAHLRPDEDAATRIRQAAERAATDPEAAAWLEKAPYGPRGVPTAEIVYRY